MMLHHFRQHASLPQVRFEVGGEEGEVVGNGAVDLKAGPATGIRRCSYPS